MAKKGIIIVAILGVIAVLAVFWIAFLGIPTEIIEQQPHRAYLNDFLDDTGLTFIPVVRNGFTYYELFTAEKKLRGFVFPETEEGWAGPIRLFVKTDVEGIIQRVHVWYHTETPIFMEDLDAFLASFTGFEAETALKWQEDVHGITGATVTAEAIIAAVQRPGKAAYKKGIFLQR